MDDCYFCHSIDGWGDLSFVNQLETDLFVVAWDGYPVSPGHMLIIPKRHFQFLRDINNYESGQLVNVVLSAQEYVSRADLSTEYERMLGATADEKSIHYYNLVLEKLRAISGPPDAYSHGINDGVEAGQTIPHLHWHIIPRWQGDVDNTVGGIRNIIADLGDYHRSIPIE